MTDPQETRDQLASEYFEQLEFDPYPVQEEALLAWFTAEQGVLVCAPTGMGKTLIAEAVLFEALRTGKTAYYTTPLIALTEQKFREIQQAAVRWGFQPEDVGLVTGNRRVHPSARVLIVVAEILFNRLLHPEAFDFSDVSAVVMDEFHSFADPQRGIVWEFSLGLLPPHIRTLLLSATVGNSAEFVAWLRAAHERKLELVESDVRRVPLTFQWVPDRLLDQQILDMADGDEAARTTPALIFCFNREECWNVAEQLKGKKLLPAGHQAELAKRLEAYDWSAGAGPKLRQILLRGVGVHHAGLLPKYKRVVEDLFQEKLLSVTVCTETLSAGINLPARSIVIPRLMKGPTDKKKLIEPSAAHQIFGRAGRPQFDSAGYVFALAHEDDVKILRWQEKYDQIPNDTKDPGLLKAKKSLKKKMPKRRTTQQYWSEQQFNKLRESPPGQLSSRGPVPWRLLAHMLDASPRVDVIRKLVNHRLMDSKRLEEAQRTLDRMLIILWRGGYVRLEPEPPENDDSPSASSTDTAEQPANSEPPAGKVLTMADLTFGDVASTVPQGSQERSPTADRYQAELAHPTPELAKIPLFRSVNPLYGVFLINYLGSADPMERLQAMESVLEMPGSVARLVRVPPQRDLPPGPLATTRLDPRLLQLGLATEEELIEQESDDDDRGRLFREEKKWVLTVADKLRLMFEYELPGVNDNRIVPVWCVGEVLEFGGDFNKYITGKGFQKQEGILFRHLLRLILLIGEFRQIHPADFSLQQWESELSELSARITECCRGVDPSSTEKTLEQVELAAERTTDA